MSGTSTVSETFHILPDEIDYSLIEKYACFFNQKAFDFNLKAM